MLLDKGKSLRIGYVPCDGYEKVGRDDWLASMPDYERRGALNEYMRTAAPVFPEDLPATQRVG